MLSRRSMFSSLVALAATLPFAGKAFGAVKDTPYLGEFYSPELSTDFLETPIRVKERVFDMVLGGEIHRVHKIDMTISDGLDRSGGLGVILETPPGDIEVEGHTYRGRRRVVLGLFEHDAKTNNIVGEEVHDAETGEVIQGGPDNTLEGRLAVIIAATRTSGFDIYNKVTDGTVLWITQDGPNFQYPKHGMAFLPFQVDLEDIHLIAPMRMIRIERT